MAVDESELDIRELRTDIKCIRQKLEGNCGEMKCIREENKKTEGRVSALENWRSGTVAALALLTILIGWGWLRPGG